MPATLPRPMVEQTPRLMTAADLAALPSELPSGPVRYELDDGRLVAMTPPGNVHGSCEMRIAGELYLQGEKRGFGEARGEVGILLWREPRHRVVGADAAFLASDQFPLQCSPEGYLETIPALVVEVSSPNDTRAYLHRKIGDYLRAGVREAWLADPANRTVSVYRPDDLPENAGADAEPTPAAVLKEGDTLRLESIIPGFELAVADIFK